MAVFEWSDIPWHGHPECGPTRDGQSARLMNPKDLSIVWAFVYEKKNKSRKQAADAIADQFSKYMKTAK